MPGEQLRATDTLANERTYLAYVRTALAFIAFGFVIARFSLFAREVSALMHHPIAGAGLSVSFGTAMAFFAIGVALLGACVTRAQTGNCVRVGSRRSPGWPDISSRSSSSQSARSSPSSYSCIGDRPALARRRIGSSRSTTSVRRGHVR